MLGEYQALAAEAAWSGHRRDAVRALSANPLVRSSGARRDASTTRSRPPTATTCPSGSWPPGTPMARSCSASTAATRRPIALARRREGTVARAGLGGCADIHNATVRTQAVDEIARAVNAARSRRATSGRRRPRRGGVQPRRRGLAGGLRLPAPRACREAAAGRRDGRHQRRDRRVSAAAPTTESASPSSAARAARWARATRTETSSTTASGRTAPVPRRSRTEALAAVWRQHARPRPEDVAHRPGPRAVGLRRSARPAARVHADRRAARSSAADRRSSPRRVLDEAEAGDPVAVDAGDGRGHAVSATTRASRRHRVGLLESGFTLVLCGRRPAAPVADRCGTAILARVPEGRPVTATAEPVAGAVLLAADAAASRARPALGDLLCLDADRERHPSRSGHEGLPERSRRGRAG